MAASISIGRLSTDGRAQTDLPEWNFKSGRDGQFHLDLPRGGYEIQVAAGAGYFSQTLFPVYEGQTTNIHLLMIESAGQSG